MAYSSTFFSTAATAATVRMMGGGSLYSDLAAGANPRSGGPLMFSYCSSHAAADITGAGFFKGCGAAPLSSTGTLHPNVGARSQNNVGIRTGDVLLNVQSSAGAAPGTVTWHGVSASTFGGSTATYASSQGYDCTVV